MTVFEVVCRLITVEVIRKNELSCPERVSKQHMTPTKEPAT